MHSRWLWVVGSLIGVVIVVIAMFVAANFRDDDRSRAHAPRPAALAPPLNSREAAVLSADLSAGSEAALRRVLVIPDGQPIESAAPRLLRALSPFTFDLSTFQALSAQDATVSATVAHPPAGTPTEWIFSLTRTSGVWKLVDAMPQR